MQDEIAAVGGGLASAAAWLLLCVYMPGNADLASPNIDGNCFAGGSSTPGHLWAGLMLCARTLPHLSPPMLISMALSVGVVELSSDTPANDSATWST